MKVRKERKQFMKRIELFFPGEPGSKQSMRIGRTKSGKVISFQDAKVKERETSIRLDALQQLHRDGVEPLPFLQRARVLKCIFIFTPLKSLKKADWQKIMEGELLPKTTKPDLTDNLKKGLFDALQGILYTNDSIIFEEANTGKYYGKQPGISLVMEGE